LVLPLSSCDYTDYRPTVQAALRTAGSSAALPPGPWDEMATWLNGSMVRSPSTASSSTATSRDHTSGSLVSCPFDSGGYYTLRSGDTWCMIRCHTYRDRVAHVDMLHVDLWHKGVNILGDSGTYKYYVADSPALERYFKDIRAHNTIEIDETGPLKLVSRFFWLPWPRAQCMAHRADLWRGEHYAYNLAPWHVVHRRTVEVLPDDRWRITDELLGQGTHQVTLLWHLPDCPTSCDETARCVTVQLPCGLAQLWISTPVGCELRIHHGERTRESVAGWTSDYYGQLAPRRTLEVSGIVALPTTLVTELRWADSTGP
jgi:hypothetical protein